MPFSVPSPHHRRHHSLLTWRFNYRGFQWGYFPSPLSLAESLHLSHSMSEICLSLEESNKKVDELKKQMLSAERSSQIIRKDLKKLKSQRGKVSDHRLCDLTHLPIQGRRFYLYPDGSCFLVSALAEEVSQYLSIPERDHINHLLVHFISILLRAESKKKMESGISEAEIDNVQNELVLPSLRWWINSTSTSYS